MVTATSPVNGLLADTLAGRFTFTNPVTLTTTATGKLHREGGCVATRNAATTTIVVAADSVNRHHLCRTCFPHSSAYTQYTLEALSPAFLRLAHTRLHFGDISTLTRREVTVRELVATMVRTALDELSGNAWVDDNIETVIGQLEGVADILDVQPEPHPDDAVIEHATLLNYDNLTLAGIGPMYRDAVNGTLSNLSGHGHHVDDAVTNEMRARALWSTLLTATSERTECSVEELFKQFGATITCAIRERFKHDVGGDTALYVFAGVDIGHARHIRHLHPHVISRNVGAHVAAVGPRGLLEQVAAKAQAAIFFDAHVAAVTYDGDPTEAVEIAAALLANSTHVDVDHICAAVCELTTRHPQ